MEVLRISNLGLKKIDREFIERTFIDNKAYLCYFKHIDANNNKIENFEDLREFNMKSINLDYNRITTLPNFNGWNFELTSITLEENRISYVSNLPYTLQYLNLSGNNIRNIDCNIFSSLNMPNLLIVLIRRNYLTEFIMNCETNIESLEIDGNLISTFHIDITKSQKLNNINIRNNQLTELPECARDMLLSINQKGDYIWNYTMRRHGCHYSRNLTFNNNPFFTNFFNDNPPPSGAFYMLEDYFCGCLRGVKHKYIIPIKKISVYYDHQNVHDKHVQNTMEKSVVKFVEKYKDNIKDKAIVYINNSPLSYDIKKLLTKKYNENTYYSNIKLTYGLILDHVINFIEQNEHKDELYKILEMDITDAIGKCSIGLLGRTINVVNGFDDSVNINISINDQVNNMIVMLKTKYKDIEKVKSEFRKEIEEREIDKSYLEWAEFIE